MRQPEVQNADGPTMLCRALYQWCRRNVSGHLARREYESAAGWAWLAGWHASRDGFFGIVADPELEAELITIGRRLPSGPNHPCLHKRCRYLHILTETYDTGGHTRLCQRWIELTAARGRQNVVLTAQSRPVPGWFRQALLEQGSELIELDPAAPLIERAAELRRLARAQAEVVFLHTHMEDPIATMAFAVEDVPPVVLMNHAESLFWFGGAIGDLVADVSRTAQERSREARGIANSVILPVPLVSSPSKAAGIDRHQRRSLGLPDDAVVFVTVGAPPKYNPVGSYDFRTVALRILQQVPRSYLVAVGPKNEGEWSIASQRSGGRLLPVGTAVDLAPFFAAADVYLEGFPCGSLTAMLEAGLAGLPCVRNPSLSTQIGHSDDLALEHVPSPANVEEYIAAAVALAGSQSSRRDEGARIQNAIVEHHCGHGWLRHLDALEKRIPTRHQLQARVTRPVPKEEAEFWMSFRRSGVAPHGWGALLSTIYGEAQFRKLRISSGLDSELHRILKMLSRQGADGLGTDGKWLGQCFAADAHFAYLQQEWPQWRKSLMASLRVAPFSRWNRPLFADLLECVVGPGIMSRFRSLRGRRNRREAEQFLLDTGGSGVRARSE